jgi:hypothetical protein
MLTKSNKINEMLDAPMTFYYCVHYQSLYTINQNRVYTAHSKERELRDYTIRSNRIKIINKTFSSIIYIFMYINIV